MTLYAAFQDELVAFNAICCQFIDVAIGHIQAVIANDIRNAGRGWGNVCRRKIKGPFKNAFLVALVHNRLVADLHHLMRECLRRKLAAAFGTDCQFNRVRPVGFCIIGTVIFYPRIENLVGIEPEINQLKIKGFKLPGVVMRNK